MRGEVTSFNHFRIKPVSVDTEERETMHHRHEGIELVSLASWTLQSMAFMRVMVMFFRAYIVTCL